jgi:hypothetical protein
MKNKFLFSILILGFSLIVTPSFAGAAVSVFSDPAAISINPRDTFAVNIRIDTEGDCVNAIDAKIKFDPSVLKAVDFGRGQSIISLWLVSPKIDQSAGMISFSGGIPGGYCGRIAGDPGLTNILGKIVFSPIVATPHSTYVGIADDSEILLNDGRGTKAEVEYRGSEIAIVSGESAANEWLSEIRADTTAPEFFTIELNRDPVAYEGKYFIAWSTTDKQSGLDHYEVFETNPWRFGFFESAFFSGEKKAFWTRAESPYILKDQNLRSKILVKAVDKIGNERIAEFNPDTSLFQNMEVDRTWLLLTMVLSILIFGITAWRVKRKRITNQSNDEI